MYSTQENISQGFSEHKRGFTSSDTSFFANIPGELHEWDQWVCFRFGPVKPNDKRDKIPFNPRTGWLASVSDPDTWATFDEAVEAYRRGGFDGIGFVFTEDDPFSGVDLDGCRDPRTGHLDSWATEIVERINSYSEASPSETGAHIIAKAKLPGGSGRRGNLEMYDHGRFFCMTGQHLGGTPSEIEDRQAAVKELYEQHFHRAEREHHTNGNGQSRSQYTDEERHRILMELRDALTAIPAVEYETWLKVGMGLHSVDPDDPGFALFDRWSQTCPEKYSREVCQKKWRTFHEHEHGITAKTIFMFAIERGWRGKAAEGQPSQEGSQDSGEEAGQKKTQSSSSEQKNAPSLPTVIVSNRQLRDMSADALRALEEKNTPPALFVRGARLVQRVSDERGRPVIRELSEAALRGFLTRSANYIRFSTGKKPKALQTNPTIEVVRDIFSLGAWPFPPLLSITECPTLRPDGSVLSVAGYDPATRLLYEPVRGLTIPPLLECPTKEDARTACAFVTQELFIDFPFRGPSDLANMLACLLTPIVRPTIGGNVPLCLLDKPTPGSGASLLSDCVALTVSGEHAAKIPIPEREGDEEIRKKITALLRDGSPIGVFDNIEGPLASSALSLLLTTPIWKDRILGRSESVTLPVRVCLIATANNITVRGDLARRAYRVRLDPKLERPWERDPSTFRHPYLLDWIKEHRGEILSKLLIMSRAWWIAGQPQAKVPRLGGYEEWTRSIGGILAFAGIEGFLDNQHELYDLVDEEAPQWAAFLQELRRHFGGGAFGIADFVNLHFFETRLWDAIPESITGDSSRLDSMKKRISWAFRKNAERIYGGLCLVRATNDKHEKIAQWRICEVGEQ